MAILIPKLNSFPAYVTAGERRVARRLESDLEEQCLCWYDIAVGSKRRYPDFIVLNPERGLLFLEVKDWKIDNIHALTHKEVEYRCESGIKTFCNPVEQARQGAYAALKLLEQDAALQQQHGAHQGKLSFPYGYGVILSNITRKQLDAVLITDEQKAILPPELVICKDDIKESVSAETLQNKLWVMLRYRLQAPLSAEKIDRIRWHFYPEIRIDSKQLSLFPTENDQPSPSDLPVALPDILKIMDPQQEILARSLGEGHRVIHGVAGSGKTLILIYRCIHLAEVLTQPVLVICYNISLAAILKSRIKQHGLEEKVQVYNFHSWCSYQLRKHTLSKLNTSENTYDDLFRSVEHYINEEKIASEQYGAVLIDEGHDLRAEWLNVLTKMTNERSGSLLFMYDDAQSIYNKRENLGFSLASVGIQAQGRTTILKLNYRNSQQILHFSRNFLQRAFDSTSQHKTEVLQPESAGTYGPEPEIQRVDKLAAEARQVLEWLDHQRNQGLRWKDIAILCPLAKTGKYFCSVLKSRDIPYFFYEKPEDKKLYDPQDDRLPLFIIPSSKGLEFHSVAVVNSSEMDYVKSDINEAAKKLYVAFTRATHQLLVTLHQDNALADLITAK